MSMWVVNYAWFRAALDNPHSGRQIQAPGYIAPNISAPTMSTWSINGVWNRGVIAIPHLDQQVQNPACFAFTTNALTMSTCSEITARIRSAKLQRGMVSLDFCRPGAHNISKTICFQTPENDVKYRNALKSQYSVIAHNYIARNTNWTAKSISSTAPVSDATFQTLSMSG